MKNLLQSLEEKKIKLEKFGIDSDKWSELQSKLQLELVYSLGKLENSTLSKAETEYVALKGITIGGKGLDEQDKAYRYFQAILRLSSTEILLSNQVTEELLIDLDTLHFLDIVPDQKFVKYSYKVPYVLTEYIEWLTQQSGSPVEIAVQAAIKLLQANAFAEHYPRTILLFINFLLLKSGYPLILVPEEAVSNYLTECAQLRSGGEGSIFSAIILRAVNDSLDLCIDRATEKASSDRNDLLKIGELAALTNETVPTIRHWTKQGLLKVADHSPGGYQLYEETMAELVLRIRYLQREERLTVSEIKEQLFS